MSQWTIDGKTSQFDFRKDRIGAGTIGGEHAVPQGFAGQTLNSVVDDLDTRITYGSYNGGTRGVSQWQNSPLSVNLTETVIGGTTTTGREYSSATLRFNGSSIGVLGGRNKYSGIMTVVIDGVVTSGRMPTYMPLDITVVGVGEATVKATDTTIVGYASGLGTFPSTGTILIGSELISYSGTSTGVGTFSFTGCTRGVNGTTAAEHFGYESIYLWASSIDLYDSTDFSNKQLLYYNPLLSPGEHTITIYTTNGASGYARIYFDGFVTGSLIGAQNLFTQVGTVTYSGVTDANGHRDLGNFLYTPSNITIVGILGYTHVEAETSNTVSMLKLGVTRNASYVNGETWPYFYVHNGPASAAFTLRVTIAYIGETI